MKQSLLAVAMLVIAAGAFAQSGPATNLPVPPAPPRTDAPGTPINPRQNTTAEPETAAAAQNAPAGAQAEPSTEPAAALMPVRELVFAEADIDQDRRVSLHEYTTFVESRVETRGTETVREETIQRFLDLDQNNDAHLSEAEASTPSQQPIPAPRPRR